MFFYQHVNLTAQTRGQRIEVLRKETRTLNVTHHSSLGTRYKHSQFAMSRKWPLCSGCHADISILLCCTFCIYQNKSETKKWRSASGIVRIIVPIMRYSHLVSDGICSARTKPCFCLIRATEHWERETKHSGEKKKKKERHFKVRNQLEERTAYQQLLMEWRIPLTCLLLCPRYQMCLAVNGKMYTWVRAIDCSSTIEINLTDVKKKNINQISKTKRAVTKATLDHPQQRKHITVEATFVGSESNTRRMVGGALSSLRLTMPGPFTMKIPIP